MRSFIRVLLYLIYGLYQFTIRAEHVESESVTHGIGTIFEAIGFSPSCVAQTLSLCERKNNSNMVSLNDIVNELKETKALISGQVKRKPQNCADLYKSGNKESGIRAIYPFSCCNNRAVDVLCNQATDGGGWTVIQHRGVFPEREDFFRKWNEYKLGFGNLNKEFWLGLENIRALVGDELMELRIDLEDFEGGHRWAKYSYFYIHSENYFLDLGKYTGDAGDGFEARHVGNPFSTKDKDNDSYGLNCAHVYKGGWWYDKCHISNLNGYQHQGNHSSYADGINWQPFHGYHYSMKETSMSLRPQNFVQ